jgi:pimeloyl-ACP methyl ester carboxylesterase
MSEAAPTRPPSALWFLLEGRAVYEFAAGMAVKPLLRLSPRGTGDPVLVLPGFLASDLSTRPLRGFLKEQGFAPHGWKLGRNLGLRHSLEERLVERLHELHRRYDRPIHVIGWSLGGIYGRDLARKAPQVVRSLITLGSPFNHDPKANRSWRLFNFLSDTKVDDITPERMEEIRATPPVPTTCIYSKTDGIAHWRCCLDQEGPRSENIEVDGSHMGLGVNPLVLYIIADRLAQLDGQWRPFEPKGPVRLLYRQSRG